MTKMHCKIIVRWQDGEYTYPARLRVAYLLYKMGKLDEAREYLHQTSAQNNQQRVQLLSIEAELLRDAKQLEAAYQVLTQGLEKCPTILICCTKPQCWQTSSASMTLLSR